MVMYSLYVYNRRGVCLFLKEWQKDNKRVADDADYDAEKSRLVYGMLYSLEDCVRRMEPSSSDGSMTIKTNAMTMHIFLTLSGFRFILVTDATAGDLKENMKHIYANLFVDFVIKSPVHDPKSDKPIDSPLFEKHLNAYVEELSCFR